MDWVQIYMIFIIACNALGAIIIDKRAKENIGLIIGLLPIIGRIFGWW